MNGKDLPGGTPDSIFISLLIAWIIGAGMIVFFYRCGGWKRRSIVAQDKA